MGRIRAKILTLSPNVLAFVPRYEGGRVLTFTLSKTEDFESLNSSRIVMADSKSACFLGKRLKPSVGLDTIIPHKMFRTTPSIDRLPSEEPNSYDDPDDYDEPDVPEEFELPPAPETSAARIMLAVGDIVTSCRKG